LWYSRGARLLKPPCVCCFLTLKKGQKKSKNKNESDQEETTDAWGFEKPSASGIPQTLKKGQKKSKNKFDQEETTFVVFQRC
jgi:hypothetical protein